MQTPANPTIGLRLALAALALLGSACTTASEPDEDDRLAVVFTSEDGREIAVGSYDPESGALTFIDRAREDMRENLGDAAESASIDVDGEVAEVDLDTGVALVAVDLEDGDALALRVARTGSRTLTLGRSPQCRRPRRQLRVLAIRLGSAHHRRDAAAGIRRSRARPARRRLTRTPDRSPAAREPVAVWCGRRCGWQSRARWC